jgi:site-specific DNA-methyltransferase (adenine-specific)
MDDYETPKEIYDPLNLEFKFNDDPCPLFGSGGLDRDWGTSTFINPPYSNPAPWVKKAYEESMRGKIIVGLLRCDTSTNYFHDYILNKAEIRFIRGRIKFTGKPAMFANIIVIWRN